MRFTKQPGQPPIAEDGSGYVMLLGDDTPVDVTLPPELGGQVIRVARVYIRNCPIHNEHRVKCLELENGIHVAECDQFYWFKPVAGGPQHDTCDLPPIPCLICGKPVPGYFPQYCCNAPDCDCQGRPINPCVCGPTCYAALIENIGIPYDERRVLAGIQLYQPGEI